MRKKKGWILFLVVALLLNVLPVGDVPVSRAEERTAAADNYGLKNPVMKAVSPPENTSHGLSNPRNENGTVTWDCLYFGNYWQEDTNGDGAADENDKKQPVKWRVLSVDGDDAFLLADMNLDVQKYQDIEDENVTWETCTMRSWLNDTFLNNMFTKSEQEMINVTDVINEGNPEYSIERGDDTRDKLYLLSYSEVMNPKYGFASTLGGVATREAANTDYVGSKWENKPENMETWSSTDDWWLRSLGGYVYSNSNIRCYGGVNTGHYNYYYWANKYSMAVRPVMHLNLSSNSKWEKAGTVSSAGGEMATTWDCIYFGNYQQGFAGWQTWKEEPIKWRVLSVDGDDAFLLADTNLDVQQYNNPMSEVTWETCTMRAWLNDDFMNKAFTVSEQEAIKVTDVINKDDKPYGLVEGNDTQDKVYLLSLSEVTNPQYGFDPAEYASNTRNAENTDYVTAGGEMKDGMAGSTVMASDWWLRSSGFGTYSPLVNSNGAVDRISRFVNSGHTAVRPALHLNLSDTSVWSYAGTVTSEKKIEEPNATNPTATPEATERPETAIPTQKPFASATPTDQPDIPPTVIPGEFTEKLTNPVKDANGMVKWDCVYFGNYWQEDTNGDGVADQNDDKTPIKWRVLSVDGDDVLLLADQNLDCQKYNETDANVTWETCTMRSWLNGYGAQTDKDSNNFFNNAFSETEQAAIKNTKVVNNDNPEYGTEGGNNTSDKVYLLSFDEVTNLAYGFSGSSYDLSRVAKTTEYAKAQGVWADDPADEYIDNGCWWLRSPGEYSDDASYVGVDGSINYYDVCGNSFYGNEYAARPALHLNLKESSDGVSSTIWSYAGTVTVKGKVEELEETEKPSATPTAPGIPSQSGTSSVIPSVPLPNSPTTPVSNVSSDPRKGTLRKVTALKIKQKKRTATVSWKKQTGVKGYQICYSTSKKWKGKKQKLVSKNNAVIKKLKKKKTYYFRVRAYRMEGVKKVYGAWSSVKKINIKK